jgi:hypothetical protein
MTGPRHRARAILLLLVLVMIAAACGGGSDDAATTTTSPPTTSTTEQLPPSRAIFTITELDNNAQFTLQVGDEVIVQLPPGRQGAPDWEVAVDPDVNVLAGGDSYRFVPSEPGVRNGYTEFTFIAAGPGLTSVTFSRGPLNEQSATLYFTAKVA